LGGFRQTVQNIHGLVHLSPDRRCLHRQEGSTVVAGWWKYFLERRPKAHGTVSPSRQIAAQSPAGQWMASFGAFMPRARSFSKASCQF